MFKSTSFEARHVGRFVFGVVLLAGVLAVLANLAVGPSVLPTALLIPAVWAAAIAAGLLASRLAPTPSRGLAVASLVVPSIGVALLAPLTVHWLVLELLGARADFDRWVQLSLVITGPTHVVFAALAGVRAYQLATGGRPIRAAAIYGICVLVSCVPFALYLFIPPALVAATGLPMLLLLHYQRVLAERERAELAGPVLPAAVVVG